jgi:hypothetical protein
MLVRRASSGCRSERTRMSLQRRLATAIVGDHRRLEWRVALCGTPLTELAAFAPRADGIIGRSQRPSAVSRTNLSQFRLSSTSFSLAE